MATATATSGSSIGGARLWVSRVLTALPILALTMSGAMKLSHAAAFAEKWTNEMGYPESTLAPIGVLELVCMIVFAVPKTRFLGAILVTAYLGGATATHVRVGQPFLIPVVLGIFAWLGLYLRDDRLKSLVPFGPKRV